MDFEVGSRSLSCLSIEQKIQNMLLSSALLLAMPVATPGLSVGNSAGQMTVINLIQ